MSEYTPIFKRSFLSQCYEESFNDGDAEELLDEFKNASKRYKIEGLIDRGGMKEISSCYDSFTGRYVADARMYHEESDAANFINEARITASLEHPNIVPVHDVGVDEHGYLFFIMKKLGGENLQSILDKLAEGDATYHENYPLSIRLEIFQKVCDAMAFAHSKGVIHLDIKPANIQVDEYGQVLVCDWGLSRNLSQSGDDLGDWLEESKEQGLEISIDNQIKGTPGYMAPEQISSDFGGRTKATDIFSVGALLHAILCFKRPFEGTSLEEILKNTVNAKLLNPRQKQADLNIPLALDAVVMKAMSHQKQDRYSSMDHLVKEIRNYTSGFATEAQGAGFVRQLCLLIGRHRISSGILIVCLVVTSVTVAVFISRLKNEKSIAEQSQKQEELGRIKAQLAEQQALAAKQDAEEAEERSLVLAKKLQDEKNIAQENRIEAARSFFENSFRINYFYKRFFTAQAVIDQVLLLDPDYSEARYYKGKLLMGELRFKEAYDILLTYKGEREIEWMLKACLLFRDSNKVWYGLDWQKVYELRKSLMGLGVKKVESLRLHITQSVTKSFSLKDRLAFARRSFQERNQSALFTFRLAQDAVSLSLRNNKIANIEELYNIGFKELDLAYTDIKDLMPIRNMPLEKLDLSHTPITDVFRLKGLALRELYLHNTKINDFSFTANMPLELLSINEYGRDLSFLKKLSKLKTLILPVDVYDLDRISMTYPNLEVIERAED